MKKTGLIFDVDGTLWDAREEVAASWSEVTEKYGLGKITTEDMSKTMGLPMTSIADVLFPHLSKEERLSLLNECTENELIYLKKHPGKLFEGEEETLAYLVKEGFPLFILSNAQPGYIEAFLEGTHLERYFIDHLCWGDNNLPKSANMKLLVERNNLTGFLYIGDTLMDEEESQKAGARFVYASYGFGIAKNPFMRLDSFFDLRKLPALLAK